MQIIDQLLVITRQSFIEDWQPVRFYVPAIFIACGEHLLDGFADRQFTSKTGQWRAYWMEGAQVQASVLDVGQAVGDIGRQQRRLVQPVTVGAGCQSQPLYAALADQRETVSGNWTVAYLNRNNFGTVQVEIQLVDCAIKQKLHI